MRLLGWVVYLLPWNTITEDTVPPWDTESTKAKKAEFVNLF